MPARPWRAPRPTPESATPEASGETASGETASGDVEEALALLARPGAYLSGLAVGWPTPTALLDAAITVPGSGEPDTAIPVPEPITEALLASGRLWSTAPRAERPRFRLRGGGEPARTVPASGHLTQRELARRMGVAPNRGKGRFGRFAAACDAAGLTAHAHEGAPSHGLLYRSGERLVQLALAHGFELAVEDSPAPGSQACLFPDAPASDESEATATPRL